MTFSEVRWHSVPMIVNLALKFIMFQLQNLQMSVSESSAFWLVLLIWSSPLVGSSLAIGVGSCFIILAFQSNGWAEEDKRRSRWLKKTPLRVLHKHFPASGESSDVKMTCLQKHSCFLPRLFPSLPRCLWLYPTKRWSLPLLSKVSFSVNYRSRPLWEIILVFIQLSEILTNLTSHWLGLRLSVFGWGEHDDFSQVRA